MSKASSACFGWCAIASRATPYSSSPTIRAIRSVAGAAFGLIDLRLASRNGFRVPACNNSVQVTGEPENR